jgi:hypothetical protein
MKEISIRERQQIQLDLFDESSGLAVHLHWKPFLTPRLLNKKESTNMA